jgi:putative membrane protein
VTNPTIDGQLEDRLDASGAAQAGKPKKGGPRRAEKIPGGRMFKNKETLLGLLVGLCATQALDWVSIALYRVEGAGARARENATRGHRPAYERAVQRIARGFGRRLSDEQVGRWGWRFHKIFGVLGGPAYLALRRRYPRLRWGHGLAFGAAFFVLIDEVMMPLVRLTPGPRHFSWKVHARGAAAHLAYGIAAETTAHAMRTSLR